MKLNKEQVDALLAYIAAAIKAASILTLESSDGGLIESMQLMNAENELREVLEEREVVPPNHDFGDAPEHGDDSNHCV